MERTINQHIIDDQNELDNGIISGQRKRHLEQELKSLKKYQENHPTNYHDPSCLELFCNENPSALECKIYEN